MKSHPDKQLVRFLKDNQPPSPSPSPEQEVRLMAAIATLPQVMAEQGQDTRCVPKMVWIIPLAIASSLALFWGQSRLSPRFVERLDREDFPGALPDTVPVAETSPQTEDEVLEVFLEETWLSTTIHNGELLLEPYGYDYTDFDMLVVD